MTIIQGVATALAIGTVSYAVYRLWKGRKVSYNKVKYKQSKNPALWYLRNHGKREHDNRVRKARANSMGQGE